MAVDNACHFPAGAGARGANGSGPDGKSDPTVHLCHRLIISTLIPPAHRGGLRERDGDAGERLPLHGVQHLLQAHPGLLDTVRLYRPAGAALLRSAGRGPVRPRRGLALPERGGHLPVHVGQAATVARPGEVPGARESAAGAAQDPAGAGRPGSHLVPQG